MTLADDFASLFAGNHEAVGTEEGGCARAPEGHAWWRQCILGHLDGSGEPIGVYPMIQSAGVWFVKWACVDFDEGDEPSWVHAVNIHRLLAKLGVASWIERSRSKGYHVWVFFTEWCPAVVARRALLFTCEQVAAPTKEINPKQESLGPGQLGNYVRLPYPGALSQPYRTPGNDARRVVLSASGQAWALADFVHTAHERRVSPQQMERLAALYTPPQPKRIKAAWGHETSDDVNELLDRMSPYDRTIYNGGPLEDEDGKFDRSDFMWKMAARIAESGRFTEDECYILLSECPWNKYRGRPDEDKRLWEIIGKIYD